MNDTLIGYLPVLVIGLVALIILVVMIRRWLVNVGAREIAIKERRYIGHKMPPGRVVATEGEVGIQADVRRRLSARARGGHTNTDAGLPGGAAAQKERP